MSWIERNALTLTNSEAQSVRRLLPNQFSSMETAAIEAARRQEYDPAIRAARLSGSDPIRQAETLLASDPIRQAERMANGFFPERRWSDSILESQKRIDDRIRLFESLDPSARQINQTLRLQESLGIRSSIERESVDTPTMLRPLPDFKPPRDYHLEALTDIRRSLRSQAQQKAEGVQSAIVEHIRQRQESLGDDQELVVYWEGGGERFQVRKFTLPNHYTVILEGVDGEGNESSRIVTMNNVEISSKVVTIPPPAKPYRIGFITPSKD